MNGVKRRKKLWITLACIGVGVAILVGILIYADFSYSVFVVPIVIDERTGIKHGIFWVILEKIQRLLGMR